MTTNFKTTFIINLDDEVVAYLKVKNVLNICAYTTWLLKKERERLTFEPNTALTPQLSGII